MNFTMNHDSTSTSLYRGSLNFFKAADIIINSDETCPPDAFGFLISHSLELTLKSYLLSRGVEESGLKNISHSLVKAWNESIKHGLAIKSEVPRWCENLDRAHSSPFLFRYARSNTGLVTPSPKKSHFELGKIIDVVGDEIGMDRNGNFA